MVMAGRRMREPTVTQCMFPITIDSLELHLSQLLTVFLESYLPADASPPSSMEPSTIAPNSWIATLPKYRGRWKVLDKAQMNLSALYLGQLRRDDAMVNRAAQSYGEALHGLALFLPNDRSGDSRIQCVLQTALVMAMCEVSVWVSSLSVTLCTE